MSTFMANKETIERRWFVIDAAGQPLGRTAVKAANILRGKHRPEFTPHADCGEFVIIVNAAKAVLTGKKLDHQFVNMVDTGDIQPLLESESLYKCLTCFACVDRCPRGVEPAKLVEAVRLAVIRGQGANHLTPDEIPALIDEDTPQQLLVSAFRKFTK